MYQGYVTLIYLGKVVRPFMIIIEIKENDIFITLLIRTINMSHTYARFCFYQKKIVKILKSHKNIYLKK